MDFEALNKEMKNKELMAVQAGGLTVEQAAETLKKSLNLAPLIEQAEGYQIIDEESAKQALSMSLQARKLRKALDESRSQIIRPHLDFQRAVNKIVKDYETKLQDIETSLSGKINNWLVIRNETSDENEVAPIEIKSMEVEDGCLSVKKTWVWELENTDQVPRQFLCLDEKKIDEAVKQGIRKIPGIQIYEKESMTMRVKN